MSSFYLFTCVYTFKLLWENWLLSFFFRCLTLLFCESTYFYLCIIWFWMSHVVFVSSLPSNVNIYGCKFFFLPDFNCWIEMWNSLILFFWFGFRSSFFCYFWYSLYLLYLLLVLYKNFQQKNFSSYFNCPEMDLTDTFFLF